MNNQIKAQVFAMYYFQKVLCTKSEKFNPVYLTAQCLEFRVLNDIDTDYLLLRDIIDLTDKEGQELAFLALYHPSIYDYHGDDIWTGEGDSKPDGSTWLEVGMRCWEGTLKMSESFVFSLIETDSEKEEPVYNQLACTDYLRSIGIALPVTVLIDGKPTTLTVTDLEREGVVKIVTGWHL